MNNQTPDTLDTGGREERRKRVLALMDRLDLNAVLLRTYANFAWYTGGGDNRVDHSSPVGVADVVVTADADYVLTNTIEAARMQQEQTPQLEVVSYPWYESGQATLRRLTGGGRVGADVCMNGAEDTSAELKPLRYVLDEYAVERYRSVGADTLAAMTETAEGLRPGMTEHEAAGNLLEACRRRGLYAPVVMAAADDRIVRYRHPVSFLNQVMHHRVMLVVCAERGGLYANVTRFVHFVEPDPEIQERFEGCESILRRMREEATRPGRTLADALHDCRRFYAEAGFPDEWKLHHQGGMTGYATREVVATPETHEQIELNQAFAWNPSITGAKAEETFVLTKEGGQVIS